MSRSPETAQLQLLHKDIFPFSEAKIASPQYTVVSHQLENSDPNKPCEDAEPLFYELQQGVYFGAIFDGITRSKRSDGSYPVPSPAKEVADEMKQATSHILTDKLRELTDDSRNIDYTSALKNTLLDLNELIREFNASLGFTKETVDYSEMDMPGAAVLLSIIANNTLHLAMVADCTAYILGDQGAQLITPVQTSVKDIYRQYLKTHDPNFNKENWRKYYRKEFRNNFAAETTMNGEIIHPGYGALTGEPGIEPFIVTVKQNLETNDAVLIASDGCISVTPVEMNGIFTLRIHQGKSNMILPEIFGRAQQKAHEKGQYCDDRTGVLFIPEHLARPIPNFNNSATYSIDS